MEETRVAAAEDVTTAAVDEVLPESDNNNKMDSNNINNSPMKLLWTTVEEPMEPGSDVEQCAVAGIDS